MSTERSIAERFGLPIYETIESFAFVRDKISIIPYLFAKQKGVLPLSQSEKGVTVAVADPLDLDSLEELRLLVKKKLPTGQKNRSKTNQRRPNTCPNNCHQTRFLLK